MELNGALNIFVILRGITACPIHNGTLNKSLASL